MPQALLTALEDIFGMTRPSEATMDTTTGVMLLPGTPPRLWKSNTGDTPSSAVLPVDAMALARSATSDRSEFMVVKAETKVSISFWVIEPSEISWTIDIISDAVSLEPSIFLLMERMDSGGGE